MNDFLSNIIKLWFTLLSVVMCLSFNNSVYLFLLEFGSWSQLTSLHLILSYKAVFCKPTIFKAHSPICNITADATWPHVFDIHKFLSWYLIWNSFMWWNNEIKMTVMLDRWYFQGKGSLEKRQLNDYLIWKTSEKP